MPKKLITGVVVAVYFFIIEYVLHGLILRGPYESVTHLLRAEGDMAPATFFVLLFVAYLIMGVLLTKVYAKGVEEGGVAEGVRFGLLMGMLMAVPTGMINFAVQPWPANIIITQMLGYVVEFAIAGVIISAMYKPESS